MARFRSLRGWLSLVVILSLLLGGATLALAGPGDTPSEAITLPASGEFSGSAAGSKQIYYRFYYGGGGANATISYSVTPDTAAAALTVFKQAADGTLVQSGTGTKTGATVTATFSDPSAQYVYFTVQNTSSATFAYVGSASAVAATPTPVLTPTATATATPIPTATPTTGCTGGERVTFNPATPVQGQQFTVTASSSRGLINVRLAGPDNPTGPTVRSEGGTFFWDWTVTPTTSGQRTYEFFADTNSLCATGTVTVSPPPLPAACRGDERLTFNPATPVVGQPLTITGTSAKGHVNVRLVGPDNPAGPAVRTISGGFAWDWNLVPTTAGARTYEFYVETNSLCTSASVTVAGPTVGPTATPAPAPSVLHDARYFFLTRYRIDDDRIWSYFVVRGQVENMGLPVSRTFRLGGFTTQLFQRQALQVFPDGSVKPVNILDPEWLPYTSFNFSVFPPVDQATKDATPKVTDPNYDTAIIDFVRANAPDVWEGMPVRFGQTFFTALTCADVFPNEPCQENLLPLFNLEVWGAPISKPARDPNNHNFVYLRFQRGIMHYDATNGVTKGILLADYLKSIITTRNLPLDLQQAAAGSRFYNQYCPGPPGWICDPVRLPSTDFTYAFEEG